MSNLITVTEDPGRVAEPTAPAASRRRGYLTLAASAFLILLVVAVVLGDVISRQGPDTVNLTNRFMGPSGSHWLGTDDLGRDMFTRLLYGGRLSLLGALIAMGIAAGIGVPLGILAGYIGEAADRAITMFNDILMSFPPLILAICIVGALGPGLVNAMIAIGVVYSPQFLRLMRSATLAVREEQYVEAAVSAGTGTLRILWRHVVPNVLSPLLIQLSLGIGTAIIYEAGLSFIGLGAQPPSASWGSMLLTGSEHLNDSWLNVVAPGILIVLTVLSLNTVGDGLRDFLGQSRRRA
jgi:ABC-type dipeptide/oligopeptide/nickel transport system permease subunit